MCDFYTRAQFKGNTLNKLNISIWLFINYSHAGKNELFKKEQTNAHLERRFRLACFFSSFFRG